MFFINTKYGFVSGRGLNGGRLQMSRDVREAQTYDTYEEAQRVMLANPGIKYYAILTTPIRAESNHG